VIAPPIAFVELSDLAGSIPIALLAGLLGAVAYAPAVELIARQERQFDRVLRQALLIDIRPRTATILWGAGVGVLALLLFAMTGQAMGALVGLAAGAILPALVLKALRRRRVGKLEDQLVAGIQTLSAGVRAGLNLVQSMQLIARDGPNPIRQEFTHLLREYEYGVPLNEAMANAADRMGSSDYRLLFSALQTHRERGGDLSETLERISGSIREIQRLNKRILTLTAQGRTTARWLACMPLLIIGVLALIDGSSIGLLLTDDVGNLMLVAIALLNVVGFLWIRKIMDIDI